MLDQITSILGRQDGVYDWTLRRTRRRSVQLYLIGRSIESLREVEVEDFELEVYNDHPFPASFRDRGGAAPSGNARGVASIKLVAADKGHLEQRIADAVTMASLVHNPPFTLPEASEYPDVPLADPALAYADQARHAALAFADELWGAVDAESGIRLSAAELFLTTSDIELHNSRGIRTGTSATRVSSELVLLAGQGDAEAETFRLLEARRLSDLRLPERVAESARFARDSLNVRAPRTRVGPVILSGEALVTLFDAFTFQASARAAFQKLTQVEPGSSILGEREVRGDRVTLRSNALRPYAVGAYQFDNDGVPGQDVLLIEDGVLRARLASQRYAQYLNIPATGEGGVTEVAAGERVLADLLGGDGPVLHVVKFSSPEVDEITGDFGSEIRLAYELKGGQATPVKGGSVSGNVFDAFTDVRLSRATTQLASVGFGAGGGEYVGPEAARFASLRVAGED